MAYNHHFTQYINEFIHHSRYTHRSDYGTKRKEDNPIARSPIVPNWAPLLINMKRNILKTKFFIELSLELGSIACTGILGTCNYFGRICESQGLSNLTPARSRLFKLKGRKGVVRWSCSKH